MEKDILKGSVCEGYTLYCSAGSNKKSILVDLDGKIVHEWSCEGAPAKMLPGGSLIGRKRNRQGRHNPLVVDPPPPENTAFPRRRGAWHDAIELIQESWDGQEEWSFVTWDNDRTEVMMSRQHHDFQREGNPVGYYAPGQEFSEHGTTLILSHKNEVIPKISEKELLDDVIYEVGWKGKLTGYEWHGADHFDEYGFDESAKQDINKSIYYEEDRGYCRWLHVNSMSLLGSNHWFDRAKDKRFDPANIIISSRIANFIAILDRKTGNIVWRVGPDFSEGAREYHLGRIFGQHHAHMIPRGLPGEGNILVFDNGIDASEKLGYGNSVTASGTIRAYSRVIEFDPLTLELIWTYGAESGEENFFSRNVGGAQRLPNGDTLITDGANGRLFEVTPEKKKVWELLPPAVGGIVYRAYRVPPDWVPGNPAGYTKWTKQNSLQF